MELLLNEAEYLEKHYTEGGVELYDGLEYKTRDIVQLADFYSLSRYLSGQVDDLGREKQFYNVVNFRVTLAKTATEFDIKDFVATSDNPAYWVQTMLLNREAYKWMKDSNFAAFLNKFAFVRPKYGGVIYKRVEGDKGVELQVCDWRNTYTDHNNVLGGPIIEKHYLTPQEIWEKRDVWNFTDDVLERAHKLREQENKDGRLEVWEITGVMDENVYRDAEGKKPTDKTEFSLQKHFIYMDCDNEEKNRVLYSTKPKELYYRYLDWEEVTGRGIGRGVIEESEEGQVAVNDSVLKQKNAMDIAGRVLIKTNADNIANNILEVDDGKIFKLDDGRDMQALQLAPAALGQFNNIVEIWNEQLDKATSTFDANTGETMPSGTPYSQTALLNQVAQRPFAFRQEEAAIELATAFNEWVYPELIKGIKGEHVLAAEFDDETLKIIDESAGNKRARQAAKEMLLNFQTFAQDQVDAVRDEEIVAQQKNGGRRYIKIPENFFEGYEGKFTLNITNEQQNKAAILTSLSTILNTVTQSFNPQSGQFAILENPTLAKIFGRLIDASGVGLSPTEIGINLAGVKKQQQPVQMQQTPQVPVEEPTPEEAPVV